MICQLFGCQNEARGNFPCCSMEHGLQFKMHKEGIKDSFDADTNRKYLFSELYTIEMAEHYHKLGVI